MVIPFKILCIVKIVRSKPIKIAYRCVKGVCLERPAIAHCAIAIAECFIEIDTKKVAGAVCKRALFCLAPLTGLAGVGVIVNLIDHPAAETITKVGANAAGLILTRPAYGFDCVLSPLELVIFGEPIPIVTDHRLLLFPISE